jgi:hypothetical protein
MNLEYLFHIKILLQKKTKLSEAEKADPKEFGNIQNKLATAQTYMSDVVKFAEYHNLTPLTLVNATKLVEA